MPCCPAANVLPLGVIRFHSALRHFEMRLPFSGQGFKATFLYRCAVHNLHLCLAFCTLHVLRDCPEDKAIWRAGGQIVHISCFIPSTLLAFLRQHVRNPGEQFCNVRCKQVFGDALSSEHRKYRYMKWKERGC